MNDVENLTVATEQGITDQAEYTETTNHKCMVEEVLNQIKGLGDVLNTWEGAMCYALALWDYQHLTYQQYDEITRWVLQNIPAKEAK